jgi:hypothetical protein
MPQQGHLDIGCLNCRAVFRQQRDAPKQANCPSCGAATVVMSLDGRGTTWSGVRLFRDDGKDEGRRFHDAGGNTHQTGCVICQHRNTRSLAAKFNELLRRRGLEELRALVSANVDDAMLASQYVRTEYRHIIEAILRQEIGVEALPSRGRCEES